MKLKSLEEKLHNLNQIYLEIASAKQDIPNLAATLLSHAAKLVGAQGGRLCLINEKGNGIEWAVMTNSPEKPVKIKMDATIGVLGCVLKTRQPFTMSNYQKWPDRTKKFDQHGFTAVAGVPIIYQDHLWGVMLMHDTREGRVFTQEDLDLLMNLGNLAAVVFSDASRLDDMKRIIDGAPTAVIAIDIEGHITHFNRQAEQMLQYAREEVIGTLITDIYYYEADARRIQRLMLDSPEGNIKEYATYLRSKKKQKISIKLSASLLFDYERRRSGSVGFFQDQRRNDARRVIASLLDEQEIFQTLVDRAWEMTGASHSAHLALDIEHKLQVTVAHPPKTLSEKQRLPIDIEKDLKIGISGRAFKTGESQLVGNVKEDPDYIEFDSQTNSELAVPIKTPEGTIGVIDVQHPQKNAFGETDLKNLEMLAQFAAVSIHNAQMYTESQIDKRRFEAIADIIRGAAQSLAINDILRSTCRLLEERIFHDKKAVVSIRLYDKEKNVLRFEPEWHESFHQQIDTKNGKNWTIQSLSKGICGLVATTRRSQNVGNVDQNNTNFFRLISTTKSEIAVPIHLNETDKLIGILDVQSPFLNAFAQNDLEFLEVLAGQLAVDIENINLTESAQRRSGEQEALRIGREAVTQSSELRETIDKIIQQVWQIARDQGKQVNSVILRQVRNEKSILVAAYPPEVESQLEISLREIDIAKGIQGKIGVSGRAVQSGKTQLVNDVSSDPDYRVLNGTTQSELTIPIRFNNDVIAVMDIECAEKGAFQEEDQHIFEDLAAQAGIAVHGSYQYDALERRSRHLEAVHEASRLISIGIKSTQRDLLYRIVEQAVERIIPASGKKATLGVIQLYNKEKNELRRESIYPKESVERWEEKLGITRSLERTGDNQIGINGRAVLEHRSQRVDDVSQDADYFGSNPTTHSELDVLLLDEKRNVLGVLGLESDELAAFDEEDERALRNLAYLAAIAIQNTQKYQELKNTNQKLEETRGTLAARTAVAWLAAERAAWQHKIVGHIGTIENYVRLLEKDLIADAPKEKFQERLVSIERVIAKTRERKIAQPLDPDEGLESFHIDNFITQWLDKFYVNLELFPGTSIQSRLKAGGASIQVNPGWFKLALDNIVNNAIHAVAESAIKEVKVETATVDGMVKIVISDTGSGIPPEVKSKIFSELIKKEDGGRGEGIGTMLSKTVFETYGGGVEILSTGPTGTSVEICIPFETSDF